MILFTFSGGFIIMDAETLKAMRERVAYLLVFMSSLLIKQVFL